MYNFVTETPHYTVPIYRYANLTDIGKGLLLRADEMKSLLADDPLEKFELLLSTHSCATASF